MGTGVAVTHRDQEALEVVGVDIAIAPVIHGVKSLLHCEVVRVDKFIFEMFKSQMKLNFSLDKFAKRLFDMRVQKTSLIVLRNLSYRSNDISLGNFAP